MKSPRHLTQKRGKARLFAYLKSIKKTFLFSVFCFLFSYVQSTFAAINTILGNDTGLPGASIKPGAGEAGVVRFFTKVVTIIQDIAAISAVLGICIVGLMFIISHGNEEKTAAAKKYMVAIIIGVVIAFTAWAIISLIDLIPNAVNF